MYVCGHVHANAAARLVSQCLDVFPPQLIAREEGGQMRMMQEIGDREAEIPAVELGKISSPLKPTFIAAGS